ncbi:MAG: prephenate dehydrogenase [Bacteroidota bacterium]
MKITIIGLGLIGGSLALDLRANGFAHHLIGVDNNEDHCRIALEEGLVDEILELEFACKRADIVVLAIPVNAIMKLLPQVLNLVDEQTVVIDMGSTKGEIASAIYEHPLRARVVLAHPMAGTEYSGPLAAVSNLFQHKAAILCDTHLSDEDAVQLAERLFKSLFMRLSYMESGDHDRHAAYVSHVSHISSFVLALTVLEKEKSDVNIFNLASGGFASTVRLAKSSPQMWRDVYEQNAGNLVDVLDSYLEKMQAFRDRIATGDFDQTYAWMEEANAIGAIVDRLNKPILKK